MRVNVCVCICVRPFLDGYSRRLPAAQHTLTLPRALLTCALCLESALTSDVGAPGPNSAPRWPEGVGLWQRKYSTLFLDTFAPLVQQLINMNRGICLVKRKTAAFRTQEECR